ncbi:MarC family protein [Escherichia coli]
MIQTFFDFPVYFKFFIGLFALVNPVGIIPVFISMTSYQTAAARKTKLTLQPTCLWPLSCGSRFFLATRFCNFLVYQLIRSVSPGASWW